MNLGDLQITMEGPVLVARLTGEVDLSNAQSIEEALALATPNQASGMILDLSELDYIDSAGIKILYRMRERLQNRGQAFRLVLANGSTALDALRLAGVIDHLEIAGTMEEAVVGVDG